MKHPTDAEIEAAKARTRYSLPPVHGDNDRIRIAYQWLDAQDTKQSSAGDASLNLKCHIEKCAGQYVSRSDVEVAAEAHPRIWGKYPGFNLSGRRVLPSAARFDGLGASEHAYSIHPDIYTYIENADGTRRAWTRAERKRVELRA